MTLGLYRSAAARREAAGKRPIRCQSNFDPRSASKIDPLLEPGRARVGEELLFGGAGAVLEAPALVAGVITAKAAASAARDCGERISCFFMPVLRCVNGRLRNTLISRGNWLSVGFWEDSAMTPEDWANRIPMIL
jgi:hypothetical protein